MKPQTWKALKVTLLGWASGALCFLALARFKDGGPKMWRGFVSAALSIFFFAASMVKQEEK